MKVPLNSRNDGEERPGVWKEWKDKWVYRGARGQIMERETDTRQRHRHRIDAETEKDIDRQIERHRHRIDRDRERQRDWKRQRDTDKALGRKETGRQTDRDRKRLREIAREWISVEQWLTACRVCQYTLVEGRRAEGKASQRKETEKPRQTGGNEQKQISTTDRQRQRIYWSETECTE